MLGATFIYHTGDVIFMSSAIAGNTSTTANLSVGSTVNGSLDFWGDTDWWRVSLTGGFAYQVWLEGASTGMGTLVDPYLAVYNIAGVLQHANDDYSFLTRDSYVTTIPQGIGGTFYISAEEYGNNGTGTYRLTFWLDQLASTSTAAVLFPNSITTDRIGWRDDDSDWYRIDLTAGVNYQFDLIGSARDGLSLALADGILRIRSSDGTILVWDNDSGTEKNARIYYTPATSGRYYLDVQEFGADAYGIYSLIVNESPVSSALTIGSSTTGSVDFLGDTDLYFLKLIADEKYIFSVDGETLIDPYLEILDQFGNVLVTGNDIGDGRDSRITYTPTATGNYYVAARSAANSGMGTYTASAWILPVVSVSDASVIEGDTGTRDLNFVVSLSAPSPVDVRLTAGTRASTASTASGDYQGVWATNLVIPAGSTSIKFSIPVNGDQEFEPNEGMRVVLSDAVMAVIGKGEARGWIIDDDEPYALLNDWLLRYQWHLYPKTGANVFPVWDSWRGTGVKVGVFDQGIDPNHSDLDGNLLTSLGRNAATLLIGGSPVLATDNHGTAVAGVIAAEADGDLTVGVAPDASLISIYSSLSGGPAALAPEIANAYIYAQSLDILNDSWGFGNYSELGSTVPWAFLDNFRSPIFAQVGEALKDLAALGRDGLGTVVVQSAGNSYGFGDDTNLHNFQNSRYIITVAATDYEGNQTTYSSPGASILIAAPGGGGNDFLGNIITTDRIGPAGSASSDWDDIIGTSFSAPVVSGVVALMLEANPNLGYRDIQQILAYTAMESAATDNEWRYNGSGNWNGGGLHYDALTHNLGFGLVDALAAARLAESWAIEPLTSANALEISKTVSLPEVIPDGTSFLQQYVNISSPIEVERVEVTVDITHPFIGDLAILLTSPAGTSSWLLWRAGQSVLSSFGQRQANIDFTFNTVLNMGESGTGLWALSVVDKAAGDIGQLNSWTLNLIGKPDSDNDTYIYTNEFAESVAEDIERATLTDTSGTDTLNAAAVTSAMNIDLAPGAINFIDGRSLTIAAGTSIENAIGGDGGDVLRGNALDNVLRGVRGDDSFDGGDGNDRIIGGEGNDTFDWDPAMRGGADTMEGGPGDDIYVVSAGDQVIELSDEGVDTVWFNLTASLSDLPEVENLFLYGQTAISALGNTKTNHLKGNDIANILGGMGGDDFLEGARGNDSLDGGDGNDRMLGGEGNDTFDWTPEMRGGADTMEGGPGDDIYVITDGDQIVELQGEGTDAIFAAASYSLEKIPNVENLILFGVLQAEATGNDGDNSIYGNTSSNLLRGMSGSDVIRGGAGNDTLDGGVGQDAATFSGARKSYHVRWDATSSKLFVTSAAEGADELLDVEELTFSDVSYAASVFQAPSAPTLSSVDTLTGAVEDTAYTITWAQLAAAANESDAQGDAIGFQVESVTSGILTKGGVAVTSGTTVLREGESLVWTGSANAAGTLDAFTIKAVDDALASTTASKVRVEVANVDDRPIGTVNISGIARQGQTLSAADTLADADGIPASGPGAIAYQWLADGQAIQGATGGTLALTQALVGMAVSVRASYTDLGDTAESVTSAATVAVANVDEPATGLVQITGTPALGALLSSSLSNLLDADGPITSTTWQWQRGTSAGQGPLVWSDIASATAPSLAIPSGADYLGSTLRLAATTVDALGGSTTLFSSPTDPIAGVPTQVSTRFWADAKPIANALIQPGAATAQATGADGSVALSGIAGPSMTLSAQKPVTAADAPSHAQAVTLQDAVAILKMISGQAGAAGFPTAARAQSLAADFDGSGTVSLADALGVLRHTVGLQAPKPSWVFVEEGDDALPSILSPGIPGPVTVAVTQPGPIDISLIGILRGDVDGSYGVYTG
jgi:subtilisin-like proprotein convertase family protein